MRLSEKETNELIFALEQRKYGHRLTSMELAQKANVALDDVNRVENQLPLDDEWKLGRIADALGITADLLSRIAGYAEMEPAELDRLRQCLAQSPGRGEVPPTCSDLGFREIY